MKKSLVLFAIILSLFPSCKKPINKKSLNVYCYDSFTGDYGPGEKLAREFEEETGIHVNLISCAGSVQLYSKLLFEGDKCIADVVIGLPDSIKIDENLFYSWIPTCKDDLVSYNSDKLIPFNYGVFAFVFNSENKSVPAPTSLKDLAEDIYKDKFILVDPRTSSVGLGLLKWSKECIEDYDNWWSKVLDNALTVADSWSTAYGLFLENEAPLVISYTTSPVYHIENENKDVYKALEFKEGHVATEEYLAIMQKSNQKEEAERFCEYILTKGQKDIALSNTMYPANINTELPASYNTLINPVVLKTDNKEFIENTDSYLTEWTNLAVK